MQHTAVGDESGVLVRRHLAFGWCGLTLGGTLGLLLEGLHALKAPVYLDVGSATTRLMWRLAHAHLGLLSLMSLALAFTMTQVPAGWKATSRWLLLGSVCLPLGFLLGGVGAHGGDPGLGILLVLPGALAVVAACGHATLLVWRSQRPQ
jgi:hypothetical protein